jgi:hypothetical protein
MSQAEYLREWRANHPERRSEYDKRYNLAHPERRKESNRRYYYANIEKLRERNRENKRKNHEKNLALQKEYREALYKNKLVALVRDKWTCQDCGALLSRGIGNAAVHHLDYTSDEPDNLISLCISCHGKKHGGRSKSA